MGNIIAQVLKWAVKELEKKCIDTARLDAEVLLAHVLGLSRIQLYLNMRAPISSSESEKFRLLIERRAAKEPVAYLIGTKEFMSLSFKVSKHVLIPRPETELLVEEIIKRKPGIIADVGTGSGAISVSSAYYSQGVKAFAIDISAEALKVAKENAVDIGVDDRIEFIQGDLLNPLIDKGIKDLDMVIANLPYIPTEFMEDLPEDVRNFEPHSALDGGDEGLELYKKMIGQAVKVLKPGGNLLIEIGYDQGNLLRDYLTVLGCFSQLDILKDLSGKDRAVLAAFI